MAPDAQSFYVSDSTSSRIRRIDRAVGIISSVVTGTFLTYPTGLSITVSPSGNSHHLYFADRDRSRIGLWDSRTFALTVVADAGLQSPENLVLNPANASQLFVADSAAHTVQTRIARLIISSIECSH